MDSSTSQMSQDFTIDDQETVNTHDGSTSYADLIDLTNYEDEEDINDPVENRLSHRVQQQGKARRARSKKVGPGPITQMSQTPSYPPPRRSQSIASPHVDPSGGFQDSSYGTTPRASSYEIQSPETYTPTQQFGPNIDNRRYSNLSMAGSTTQPFVPNSDSRRHSYRSMADSTYGRYDPFSGGPPGIRGISPSPSLIFDDNQSFAGESVHNLLTRGTRNGSMVLLNNNSGDPNGDAALWLDQSDYAAMCSLSEIAKPGKPKLAAVLEEEIQKAQGSMMVASKLFPPLV